MNIEEARHLMRRAAFGGSQSETEELASRSREDAVDFLINYQQIDNSELENLLAASFNLTDPTDGQVFNQGEIRRWWFTRMVKSRRQFEEKMTLFWHNHFATALSKVQDFHMFNQNLLLRQNALGVFDALLLAVSRDPAMLIWLDNITNVLGSPNENFGRELMELFSMGIRDVVTGDANYTEDDVKEVARAFTGWNFRRRPGGGRLDFEFFLRTNQHDNGSKTIFAGTPWQTTGNLNGDDVITVISQRRATARYITWKLFNFFVMPVTTSASDQAMIDRFAQVYMNNGHSIKELVRAIFTSDEFFSERARFSLVKQPVELVVGAIRLIGGEYNQGAAGRGSSNVLAGFARNQGEDIFNPPDVAGWEFNLGWINTATMLERYNYTNSLVNNRNFTNPGIFVTLERLKKLVKKNSKKTVTKFFDALGVEPGNSTRKRLQTYLETGDNGQPIPFSTDDAYVDKKVRGLVHQIMCLPEFHLN